MDSNSCLYERSLVFGLFRPSLPKLPQTDPFVVYQNGFNLWIHESKYQEKEVDFLLSEQELPVRIKALLDVVTCRSACFFELWQTRGTRCTRGISWRSVGGLGYDTGRCKDLQGAATFRVRLALASPRSDQL